MLTDHRDRFNRRDPERIGQVAVVEVVGWWADQVRERRSEDVARRRYRSVTGEVTFLRSPGVTAWMSRWHQVGDMASEVEQVVTQLRSVLGETEQTIPIGTCPVIVEIDEFDVGWPCDGEIRARAFGYTATCRRDRSHRWQGVDELRALGQHFGHALLDVPGLARYFEIPQSTVRTWRSRDRWMACVLESGRKVFRLQEALGSWSKRRDSAA